MSSLELFHIISKQWASVNDIKKIAGCGRDSATRIRNSIKRDILNSGKHLPSSKTIVVPMESVIEYLNLNINHIAQMASSEKQLRGNINAGI